MPPLQTKIAAPCRTADRIGADCQRTDAFCPLRHGLSQSCTPALIPAKWFWNSRLVRRRAVVTDYGKANDEIGTDVAFDSRAWQLPSPTAGRAEGFGGIMHRAPLASHQQDRVATGLPFVESLARRMASTMPHSIDLGDLVQDGVLGLIDAARRFDAD